MDRLEKVNRLQTEDTWKEKQQKIHKGKNLIKLLKTNDQERKILRAARKKVTYRGTKISITKISHD